MEQLEHVTNAELLSKLAGKAAADALVQQFGGLTDLAKGRLRSTNIPRIGASYNAIWITCWTGPG
jgi:hypothetical protein